MSFSRLDDFRHFFPRHLAYNAQKLHWSSVKLCCCRGLTLETTVFRMVFDNSIDRKLHFISCVSSTLPAYMSSAVPEVHLKFG